MPCGDDATARERGVPACWEEFDRWARPRLLPVVARFCPDGVDPQDVVQESMIRAEAYHAGALPPYASLLAWCRQDAIWRAVKANRDGFRAYELPAGDGLDVASVAPLRALIEPGHEGDAVERLHAVRALDRLSPEDREVLLLADGAGFGSAELAATLGITRTAARSRLMRARARFAKVNAAMVPLGLRMRRWWDECGTPASGVAPASGGFPVAVSVAALSLLAAVGAAAVRPSGPDGGYDARLAPHPDRAPGARAAAAPRRVPPSVADSGPSTRLAPPGARSDRATVLVGSAVPSPPALPDPKVTACPEPIPCNPRREGDTVVVSALGIKLVDVSQAAVRTCEVFPDVPPGPVEARCTRQEPDQWTVEELPPRTPGGSRP